MKWLNADIAGVTITFGEQHEAKVKHWLTGLRPEDFYERWINASNPSPNKVGFFIDHRSDEETFCPNFHDLPFYYGDDYRPYIETIKKHVRMQGFPTWDGHCSPLPWADLEEFVRCLRAAPV